MTVEVHHVRHQVLCRIKGAGDGVTAGAGGVGPTLVQVAAGVEIQIAKARDETHRDERDRIVADSADRVAAKAVEGRRAVGRHATVDYVDLDRS